MFLRILRAPRLRSLVATTSVAALVITALAPTVSARPSRRKASRQNTVVSKQARVSVETAYLRSGPDSSRKTVALLDQGHTSRIVRRSGDWLRVRTAEGAEGWVHCGLVKITVTRRVVRAAAPPPAKAAGTAKSVTKLSAFQAPAVRARFVRGTGLRPTPRSIGARIERVPAAPAASPRAVTVVPSTPNEGTHFPTEPAAPQSAQVAAVVENRFRVVPATPSRTDFLVRTALSYRGTPYRMGGRGRGSFDCSGFTSFLFAKAGSPLPRTARQQFQNGLKVSRNEMQPGDLVFFKNTYRRGVSHVGIYIGNGNFIHAASSGRGVRVDSLNGRYYARHWAGARRKIAP